MKKIKPSFNLDKEVKNTGIVLIVLGVLHVILYGFLSLDWGLILIIFGIMALFYRSKKMLLTFGVLMVIVGIWNAINYILSYEGAIFWMFFGIFQIVWGIQSINKFKKIKENPKYVVKEKNKKNFVWYGLRVGFIIMILSLWINVFFNQDAEYYFVFLIIWMLTVLFTFIMSLVHLKKYKSKFFSVMALVFSSYLIITFLIGIIIGLSYAGELYGSENVTEAKMQEFMNYVDTFCYTTCYEFDGFYDYDYQYEEAEDEVYCYCLNSDYDVILQKQVPLE